MSNKMEIPDVLKKYEPLWNRILHTGSRVICKPPPKDTDDDWLMLISEDNLDKVRKMLFDDGAIIGGSGYHELTASGDRYNGAGFDSYRYKDINIMVTVSPKHFWTFVRATALATKLNLKTKQERVTLFEAINGDNYPEDLAEVA